MEISGTSSVVASANAYASTLNSQTMATPSSSKADLNVQDEIAISVMNQVRDQQKVMVEALTGMMEQTAKIDVYA